MLHEPTWGFGAKEDAEAEDEGGNEGRTELQTPGDATGVFNNDIGAETQENTWGRWLAH